LRDNVSLRVVASTRCGKKLPNSTPIPQVSAGAGLRRQRQSRRWQAALRKAANCPGFARLFPLLPFDASCEYVVHLKEHAGRREKLPRRAK